MDTSPASNSRGGLSEQERAAAFSQTFASRAEGGAPRVGPTRIPPKFVLFVTAVFVVLGIGGTLAEHYMGGSQAAAPTTTFTLPPVPVAPSGNELSASLKALMGLKEISNARAPDFSLSDQARHSWRLADARGKVVVLTFYSRECNDICTVLGPEIVQAEALLGHRSSTVQFVIVNTDPSHSGYVATPSALTSAGLSHYANVHFLTGPLNQLNAVWTNYGVGVSVGTVSSQVAHNNVMYFITPGGAIRYLAVPFGNENHDGIFSLDAATIHKFAEGIFTTAVSLAK